MKKESRGSVLKIKFFTVLAAFIVMLPLMASVSYAAGIEWSSGFPKMSQKNALLQWSPVKGATEYKIYKGEHKGKGKLIATVKTNRYIDKDLSSGKTFYYSVAAVVGGAEGARSAEGSVSIAAEKVYISLKTPKIVGGHIKDLPGGKASVGIRWEGAAGTDLVGINVYRSQSKGTGYAMVGSSQSDMYEDTDVERGKTYYYVVTAVDSQFNETKYSNELDMNVPAPVVKAETPKEAAKAETTTMKPAKLLFRIPTEQDARRRGAETLLPGKPQGLAVDEAVGHIYVVSIDYRGVLVYDMDGNLQFGIRKDGVSGEKKFLNPKGVAVGDRGNIYVTDAESPDISVFDFSGRPIDTIKVDVSHLGRQAQNTGIALGKDGEIYVTDPASNSLQALDSRGRRLFEAVGIRAEAEAKKDKSRQLFNGPTYLTLTNKGDIVFIDSGWVRLLMYGKDGEFKRTIGKLGTGVGELYYPNGLTIGVKGEILVGSALSPNIQAFSTDGKFLYALCNEKCDGPIDVGSIRGICVDGKNRLYVAEGTSNRVSVFQLEDRTVEVIPPK